MQNKDNTLKEIKSLLTSAQKEVTRELNTQKSFLAKLFAGAVSESLKIAQSNIAKALNNLDNFSTGDSQVVAKLQANMNDRDAQIKALEASLVQSKDHAYSLESKIKLLENQQAKQEEEFKKATEAQNKVVAIEETVKEVQVDNQALVDLEAEKERLQKERTEINEKYQGAKKELKDAQNLALEFSKRMTRLKSEILSA